MAQNTTRPCTKSPSMAKTTCGSNVSTPRSSTSKTNDMPTKNPLYPLQRTNPINRSGLDEDVARRECFPPRLPAPLRSDQIRRIDTERVRSCARSHQNNRSAPDPGDYDPTISGRDYGVWKRGFSGCYPRGTDLCLRATTLRQKTDSDEFVRTAKSTYGGSGIISFDGGF